METSLNDLSRALLMNFLKRKSLNYRHKDLSKFTHEQLMKILDNFNSKKQKSVDK